MSVDDKYTYPGSGGVLMNAAGYRTHRKLDEAMNDVASITTGPLAGYLRTHLVSARDDELAGRELGVFEREDLEIMRGSGVDVDGPARGPEAAPSSRTEQWPSLPEQSRGSDLER